MARRRAVVDPAMLQGLVNSSMTQEVQRGTPKTSDPAFPVFATPVNRDIIVYIPHTNVVSTENGEIMQVLPSHIHDTVQGKSFSSIRCISGLSGPQFDELGYDGTCPACEAMSDVWELYKVKLEAEAKRYGITDVQDDPNDTLGPIRKRILAERAIKDVEEYVTFTAVIIPTKAKYTPTDDAMDNLEPVFVHWRKQRYEDNITAELDKMMNPPSHPAGLFWYWKFSYDTKGKEATPRDSAKNAKYSVISDPQALAIFEPFREKAEEVAKEFTLLKAAEVVIAVQFLYKEDLQAEVDGLMSKTRQLLKMANQGGGVQPAIGTPQQQGANPLANFGTSPSQGGEVQQKPPQNLGQQNQQQQPQQGSPVSFG